MAQINVSEESAAFINVMKENAEGLKCSIADAMMTAIEVAQDNPENREYMNMCSVLATYNRFINKLL